MKTYIHVGYPKNASTTLQTDVFPKIKNTIYMGRSYDTQHPFISKEFSEAMYSIWMQDSIDFSFEEVSRKIDSAMSNVNGQTERTIISSEGFANNFVDRGIIANRLNKFFPDAKILIVIRNQMDALLSMYSFLVCQMGRNVNISYGRPSVRSFAQWIQDQEEYLGRSFITTLMYYEFFSQYKSLFGNDNVTVLFFEELANSPELFFAKLATFLDLDSAMPTPGNDVPKRNRGPTQRAAAYYRLRGLFPDTSFSKYMPNIASKLFHNYLARQTGGRKKEFLLPDTEKRLLDMYRDSNNKLQQELGIDISKYGYNI